MKKCDKIRQVQGKDRKSFVNTEHRAPLSKTVFDVMHIYIAFMRNIQVCLSDKVESKHSNQCCSQSSPVVQKYRTEGTCIESPGVTTCPGDSSLCYFSVSRVGSMTAWVRSLSLSTRKSLMRIVSLLIRVSRRKSTYISQNVRHLIILIAWVIIRYWFHVLRIIYWAFSS